VLGSKIGNVRFICDVLKAAPYMLQLLKAAGPGADAD
jgi:hypothetical protein